MFRRIFSVLTALALIPALLIPAYAEDETITPQYSYVLMEGGTSALLYSENGNAVVPAHHSAKLMTLLLVMEAMDRGELNFDTVLKTSNYANSMQGAQIWLMPNEEITVDELISAITVGNANDACVVLAEAVGKTEKDFVLLMNKRANELGMDGTSYADSTGISPESVTTACDAAVLASALTKYESLRGYFTTWVTSVRGGKTELASTNRLILTYDGITGMKAYYSEALGNCVIATAERNGLTMVCVIFGEKDEFARFTTAKEKLNAGFNAYTLYQPKRSDIYTEPVKVSGGERTEVKTVLGPTEQFVIRKSIEERIEVTTEYFEDIKAPLEAGDRVGRAVWSVDGEEIYSCPIAAEERVRKMNIFISFARVLRSIIKM